MHPGIPITDTSYSGKQRKEIWSVWPYGEEEQIKNLVTPKSVFGDPNTRLGFKQRASVIHN